jgi:hypothetical protein
LCDIGGKRRLQLLLESRIERIANHVFGVIAQQSPAQRLAHQAGQEALAQAAQRRGRATQYRVQRPIADLLIGIDERQFGLKSLVYT